jgi:hypothetical protein
MKKNFLIFLFLSVLLFALIFITQRKPAGMLPTLSTPFSSKEISVIEISTAKKFIRINCRTSSVENFPERFTLRDQVQAACKAAENLPLEESIQSSGKLAEFDLLEPKIQIRFLDASQNDSTLALGALNDYLGKRYVLFNGEVSLIPEEKLTSFLYFRYQSPSVQPIPNINDVTGFRISPSRISPIIFSAKEKYEVKKVSDHWNIIRGVTLPANDDCVKKLLQMSFQIPVDSYLGNKDQLKGILSPTSKIEIFGLTSNSTPLRTLTLGNFTPPGSLQGNVYLELSDEKEIFQVNMNPQTIKFLNSEYTNCISLLPFENITEGVLANGKQGSENLLTSVKTLHFLSYLETTDPQPENKNTTFFVKGADFSATLSPIAGIDSSDDAPWRIWISFAGNTKLTVYGFISASTAQELMKKFLQLGE